MQLVRVMAHPASCKLVIALVYWSDTFSQWLLVLINVQRLVILYFPRRVQRWTSTRATHVQIATVAIYSTLLLGTPVFLAHNKTVADGERCAIIGASNSINGIRWVYLLHTLLAANNKMLYPAIINAVLIALILVRLFQFIRLSRKLVRAPTSPAVPSRAELLNTMNLMLLAIVQTCSHFLAGCVSTVLFVNTFLAHSGSRLVILLDHVIESFGLAAIIATLVVYYARIRVFRLAVCRMLTCGLVGRDLRDARAVTSCHSISSHHCHHQHHVYVRQQHRRLTRSVSHCGASGLASASESCAMSSARTAHVRRAESASAPRCKQTCSGTELVAATSTGLVSKPHADPLNAVDSLGLSLRLLPRTFRFVPTAHTTRE